MTNVHHYGARIIYFVVGDLRLDARYNRAEIGDTDVGGAWASRETSPGLSCAP